MTTTFKPLTENVTFKAGKYLIADPCYVTPDESWSDFCDILFAAEDSEYGGHLFESEGIKYWVGGTAYGDGLYAIRKNGAEVGTIGVDAGLLSIIPVKLLKKWNALKEAEEMVTRGLVTFVEVDKDFTIHYSGGDFKFADFEVWTSENDPDLEDEEGY